MKVSKNNIKYKRRVSLYVLYDEDHKILLQKRDLKAPTLPGYWAFFGGGIEKDETPTEAVKREAEEELGVILSNPVLLKRYVMEQDGGLVEKFFFMEPLITSIDQLSRNQVEGDSLGLFTITQIKNELLFPKYNMIILDDIENHLRN